MFGNKFGNHGTSVTKIVKQIIDKENEILSNEKKLLIQQEKLLVAAIEYMKEINKRWLRILGLTNVFREGSAVKNGKFSAAVIDEEKQAKEVENIIKEVIKLVEGVFSLCRKIEIAAGDMGTSLITLSEAKVANANILYEENKAELARLQNIETLMKDSKIRLENLIYETNNWIKASIKYNSGYDTSGRVVSSELEKIDKIFTLASEGSKTLLKLIQYIQSQEKKLGEVLVGK